MSVKDKVFMTTMHIYSIEIELEFANLLMFSEAELILIRGVECKEPDSARH